MGVTLGKEVCDSKYKVFGNRRPNTLKAERDQLKADYEDLRRKMKFMKQHLAEMIKLVS